jgi:hypothetical protein
MKTLMFVTVVSLLSATGAFAQVMFDPNAPSPVYGPYPRHPDVGLFDQGHPALQQSSRSDTRRAYHKGDQRSVRIEPSNPTR